VCSSLAAADGPLDFTEGEPSEAPVAAADLAQRSLIDVEEEVSYDDLAEPEVG
jgi:hypothetical protein